MERPWHHLTIVTRLVVCLVVAGLATWLVLVLFESRQAESLLQSDLTQRVCGAARKIEYLIRTQDPADHQTDFAETISLFGPKALIVAARLSGPPLETIQYEQWPENVEDLPRRTPSHPAASTVRAIDLRHRTLVRTIYDVQGQQCLLELLVDGPAARRRIQSRMLHDMFSSSGYSSP